MSVKSADRLLLRQRRFQLRDVMNAHERPRYMLLNDHREMHISKVD
jgi:hypothetical protein